MIGLEPLKRKPAANTSSSGRSSRLEHCEFWLAKSTTSTDLGKLTPPATSNLELPEVLTGGRNYNIGFEKYTKLIPNNKHLHLK